MSDKQFTFFELHFHDGVQLGPRTLGGDDGLESITDAADQTTETESTAAESDDSGPSVLAPLLGLGLLAAAAYAARKLLAEGSEGLDALDDIEENAEEAAEEFEAQAEESVPIEITTPEETDGGRTGLLVAGAIGLLVVLALAARKLLDGGEEIVVEE